MVSYCLSLVQTFVCFWLFESLPSAASEAGDSTGWNTKNYQKREHCLTKPYQHGSAGGRPLWDFGGTAMITSNYVRLTADKQGSKGYLWNSVPVELRSWEMHVHFKVSGNHKKDMCGDGFALWYTRDRMKPGDVFGNEDPFVGLGIFVDTYSNHNGPHNHAHPYISAMVSNGTLRYDHDMDGTHTELAGCEAQFRNKDYDTFLLVRFENRKLTVKVDVDDQRGWRPCFEVEGVHLPTGFFFGISAATGDLVDNHDVIGVKTYELPIISSTGSEGEEEKEDPAFIVPSAEFYESPRARKEDAEGGLSGVAIFFIVLGVLIAVVVVGVVIVVCLDSSNSMSTGPGRKRFY